LFGWRFGEYPDRFRMKGGLKGGQGERNRGRGGLFVRPVQGHLLQVGQERKGGTGNACQRNGNGEGKRRSGEPWGFREKQRGGDQSHRGSGGLFNVCSSDRKNGARAKYPKRRARGQTEGGIGDKGIRLCNHASLMATWNNAKGAHYRVVFSQGAQHGVMLRTQHSLYKEPWKAHGCRVRQSFKEEGK